MYHYKESGLQNVWLVNGYAVHKTKHGKGVSIQNVQELHCFIGSVLAKKPHLTGCELRFLRKEMEMSQSALGRLLGTSEQNISLWERRGRVPKTSDRLIRLIYLEHTGKNPKIVELIERINQLDSQKQEKMTLAANDGNWKVAA